MPLGSMLPVHHSDRMGNKDVVFRSLVLFNLLFPILELIHRFFPISRLKTLSDRIWNVVSAYPSKTPESPRLSIRS